MKRVLPGLSVRTSLLLSGFLFLALGWFSMLGARGEVLCSKILWSGLVAFMAFRVFATGRVGRWRSVFFVILAWGFLVQFKAALIGLEGSAFITSEIQEVPYCHIAIVSSFLNHVYQQYLAVVSGAWFQWSVLTWAALLWVLITLALGQAWCSWACFYGGLDTGFSRLLRRPLVKWVRVPKIVREMPAAILLAVMMLSLVAAQPIFCLWACPLKLGTGFLDPVHFTRQIQLAIFASVGIVFVVVLPFLTRKRAFCGLVCPFSAWQAFFGRVNPYRVVIVDERCTQCQLCVKVCPTFAIEKEDVQDSKEIKLKISAYCNRCGECMDACPTGAIDYSIGYRRSMPLLEGLARPLFLLTAWLVAGTVSLLFVPEAMLKFWHWIV